MPHRIAIIGSGLVGVALATQLVKAGHILTISNSRGPETLQKQATETGAPAIESQKAAEEAEIVILATPLSSIVSLAQTFEESLRPEAIIIDTCNYYPSRDGHIKEIDQGMLDSIWVSQNFPIPVVKAFNNIIAASVVTDARAHGTAGRAALPVSADDEAALNVVMAIVDDVGFDPYNAGPLAETWRYQPGQPAYCTEPTLEQLSSLLLKANSDRKRVDADRDKTRELLEKLPDGYSPQTLLRVSRLSNGLDRWSIRSWFAAALFVFAIARGTIMSYR